MIITHPKVFIDIWKEAKTRLAELLISPKALKHVQEVNRKVTEYRVEEWKYNDNMKIKNAIKYEWNKVNKHKYKIIQ